MPVQVAGLEVSASDRRAVALPSVLGLHLADERQTHATGAVHLDLAVQIGDFEHLDVDRADSLIGSPARPRGPGRNWSAARTRRPAAP